MLLLGWIILTLATRLRRVMGNRTVSAQLRSLTVGVTGALLAVLVGNLTQLFLVQAQTGSLVWLLVGVAARVCETTDGAAPAAAEEV